MIVQLRRERIRSSLASKRFGAGADLGLEAFGIGANRALGL
jgi:hypothetical protein